MGQFSVKISALPGQFSVEINSRPREIQRAAKRHEISNLGQFHVLHPISVGFAVWTNLAHKENIKTDQRAAA